MSAFTGREIEFEVDGLDVPTTVVRVSQLSSYLIAHGLNAVIKNGSVFEAKDRFDHRVAVLHRNSRFNIGPVISFWSLKDPSGRLKTYQIVPASIARNHPLLIILSKVGLFDTAQAENQIELRPDHYVSEVRLESFDDLVSRWLTQSARKGRLRGSRRQCPPSAGKWGHSSRPSRFCCLGPRKSA